MAPYKVTCETVEKAKAYLKDFPKLTNNEIGSLCGVSGATVSLIKNGEYDYLLSPDACEGGQSVRTAIPYEELKRLWTYETIINELLRNCRLAEGTEDVLFLPYKAFDRILKTYIPDETEKTLTELQTINTLSSEMEFCR